MNDNMLARTDIDDFESLKSVCHRMNVDFTVTNQGLHWQFRRDGFAVLEAWPSASKFRAFDGPVQTSHGSYFAKMQVALTNSLTRYAAAAKQRKAVSSVAKSADDARRRQRQRHDLFPKVVLALVSGGFETGDADGANSVKQLIEEASAITTATVEHMDSLFDQMHEAASNE